MRLRLFHKLALVTTLLMAVTIVAIAGVMARNLRNGFNSYLDERDREELKSFASVVREALEQQAKADANQPLNIQTLLDEHARREGIAPFRPQRAASVPPGRGQPPPHAGPPPRRLPNGQRQAGLSGDQLPPADQASISADPSESYPPDGPAANGQPQGPPGGFPQGPPPGFAGGPPQDFGARPMARLRPRIQPQPQQGAPRGPLPSPAQGAAAQGAPPANPPLPGAGHPAGGFDSRVAVLAPDGHLLAGRSFAQGSPVFEEPVLSNGNLVARVQLLKLHRVSEDLDRRFLRSQYVGIGTVSGLAFIAALAGILLLSRSLAQPLRAAQSATAQIAQGDFNVRIRESGGDEVADLVRNINAMAGSLQSLENSRKNWLAQLSHELRTPLTVLQGECEAMIDGVRPVSADAVAALHERVMALKRIVEDLHTVSLADLGALPHVFNEMDAVALVRHVLAASAQRFERHGITATFDCALDHLEVCWDAGRIEQLLENLLENSMRYTDSPGIIEVQLAADQQNATLRWQDSPPGLPAQDLAQIFEPLYRADAARSRKLGGSGLGLAICRAIVTAHCGKIAAHPSPLGGVCIQMVLPRTPRRHDDGPHRAPRSGC